MRATTDNGDDEAAAASTPDDIAAVGWSVGGGSMEPSTTLCNEIGSPLPKLHQSKRLLIRIVLVGYLKFIYIYALTHVHN